MKREHAVFYQPVEDGWIVATVPELPGAVTQANAAKDAPSNAIWEKLTVDVPAA